MFRVLVGGIGFRVILGVYGLGLGFKVEGVGLSAKATQEHLRLVGSGLSLSKFQQRASRQGRHRRFHGQHTNTRKVSSVLKFP